MTTTLIYGATSSIARALARRLAAEGHDLLLAGRDPPELEATRADLEIRYGIQATTIAFEAREPVGHLEALDARLAATGEEIAGVHWCVGYLGDQDRARHDPSEARALLRVNLEAGVTVLGHLADRLEAQGEGFLCVLSSVAGERGRAANYPYGAAKAGLSTFLEGLAHRLHPTGVRVTTIKPGFVDTKMTYGRDGMFLVASPEHVARVMHQASRQGSGQLYVPWFWRPAAAALRALPSPVFHRLNV